MAEGKPNVIREGAHLLWRRQRVLWWPGAPGAHGEGDCSIAGPSHLGGSAGPRGSTGPSKYRLGKPSGNGNPDRAGIACGPTPGPCTRRTARGATNIHHPNAASAARRAFLSPRAGTARAPGPAAGAPAGGKREARATGWGAARPRDSAARDSAPEAGTASRAEGASTSRKTAGALKRKVETRKEADRGTTRNVEIVQAGPPAATVRKFTVRMSLLGL